jgi:peptidoglycan/LPS O-acetylase OafA/YrhL
MPGTEEKDRHLPALDGLRGLAVLMVLCAHLCERFFFLKDPWRVAATMGWAGWTGVDLFFVLSGFLITGILWESRTANHYFKNFYARRTLRLFPLYYATLAIVFGILPLTLPLFHSGPGPWRELGAELQKTKDVSTYWIWYVTYSVDFLLASKGAIFTAHFWSLAVEEHFYLAWPFLIHRLSHSTLKKVLAFIILGTVLVRCCLLKFLIPYAVFCLTPCRMDGLAMGAMIALILRQDEGLASLRSFARSAFPVLLILCFLLLLLQKGHWSQYGIAQQTVGYSVTPASYACVLIFALGSKQWAAAFSNRFLRFFGKYSYAIYVIHPFFLDYLRPFFTLERPGHFSVVTNVLVNGQAAILGRPWATGLMDGAGYAVSVVALSLLAAMASWRIIELPFLNLKRFFPYENRRASSGPDLVLSLARHRDEKSAGGSIE